LNRTHASAAGAAVLLLALTACGSQSATTSAGSSTGSPASAGTATSSAPAASPSTSASASTSASSPAPAARGSYIDYSAYAANPQMYAAGKVVLFFHAGWCPKCKETDDNLTADPSSLPAGLTVVKADFDTETDLRQKYGVGVQHTFVQVDRDGNELRTWTGTYTGEDIARKTV
jgi:thiol-disulfide isomerase/thioredoxin